MMVSNYCRYYDEGGRVVIADKKIVRLNNEYTTQQLNQMQAGSKKSRKRGYLAMILVVIILVMMLPTINLIKSYQVLQSRRILKLKSEKQSAQLDRKLAIKKANIDKLQDPTFIAKYARAKYLYSKDGEKIFPISELSDGGVTEKK